MEGVAYESEESEEEEDEDEEEDDDGEDEDEKMNELVNILNHCISVLFYANQTVWIKTFFSPELPSIWVLFYLFINMFSDHTKQQCFGHSCAKSIFTTNII